MTGAAGIAAETAQLRDSVRAACRLTVNGRPMYVIAPDGHPIATIGISTTGGRVTRITPHPARAGGDRFDTSGPLTALWTRGSYRPVT